MKLQPLSFKSFNEEITDLYNQLKDNNHFSDEDLKQVFKPLDPNEKSAKLPLIFLTTLATLTFLYYATNFETISWNFSALGRITLIKLLPYWDWTHLKNQKCLIENTLTPKVPNEATFNCDLCENLKGIDLYEDSNITPEYLKKRYLDVDNPILIKTTWKKSTPKTFINEILQNVKLTQSQPCNVATNTYSRTTTMGNLLRNTQLFDSFFLHFKNCEFGAMKEFRAVAPRPSFLPPELSPVQFNWLLWSNGYNVTRYRPIALRERYAMFGQISGGNFVKLVARGDCYEECPIVELKLKEGEVLMVTGLWNLEYRPDLGENIAVVLEMH